MYYLPQQAKIEEIGIGGLNEIEGHRVEGFLFVQYRSNVHDAVGKTVDAIVQRFTLPVCIFSTHDRPDLRELTLSQIESLFMIEAQRVFKELPSPLRRIDF